MNVRLIIPTIDEVPVDLYRTRIAHIAGGYTAWTAIGGWINEHHQLVEEPITVVETSIGKDNSNAINQLRQVAVKVCNDLDQDCVFLSFDGEAHYVLKDGSDMTPA